MRTGDSVRVELPSGELQHGYVVKVLCTGRILVAVEDLRSGGFEPHVMRPEAVRFEAGRGGRLPDGFVWAHNRRP